MTATTNRTGTSRRFPSGAAGLALILLVAAAALAFVAARGPERPRTLQDRTRAVAAGLRCPVCQDLSVADSPSSVAGQMRATISRDLRTGQTPGEIRARFVAAYGEWILLAPPRSGINLVAWIAPFLLLVGGIVVAAAAVERWTAGRASVWDGGEQERQEPQPSLSDDDRQLLDRAMSKMGEELE